jgi:hypothetical protein
LATVFFEEGRAGELGTAAGKTGIGAWSADFDTGGGAEPLESSKDGSDSLHGGKDLP